MTLYRKKKNIRGSEVGILKKLNKKYRIVTLYAVQQQMAITI